MMIQQNEKKKEQVYVMKYKTIKETDKYFMDSLILLAPLP